MPRIILLWVHPKPATLLLGQSKLGLVKCLVPNTVEFQRWQCHNFRIEQLLWSSLLAQLLSPGSQIISTADDLGFVNQKVNCGIHLHALYLEIFDRLHKNDPYQINVFARVRLVKMCHLTWYPGGPSWSLGGSSHNPQFAQMWPFCVLCSLRKTSFLEVKAMKPTLYFKIRKITCGIHQHVTSVHYGTFKTFEAVIMTSEICSFLSAP